MCYIVCPIYVLVESFCHIIHQLLLTNWFCLEISHTNSIPLEKFEVRNLRRWRIEGRLSFVICYLLSVIRGPRHEAMECTNACVHNKRITNTYYRHIDESLGCILTFLTLFWPCNVRKGNPRTSTKELEIFLTIVRNIEPTPASVK
jgi:hypothetical protein